MTSSAILLRSSTTALPRAVPSFAYHLQGGARSRLLVVSPFLCLVHQLPTAISSESRVGMGALWSARLETLGRRRLRRRRSETRLASTSDETLR
ncbi:hypothetical protein BDV98DRAFT_577084 [Pterulicium gracile]|uniref:Uncharacterized protein n=1 Tax=Pterulicium gracile TaxID=1884261 RepID=A0A5C3Q6I0_9AGAR|nr:hypothetical protein BDV98DRAFT_577084 [Pterula gracilis]